MGYSNGANIAESLLLLNPQVMAGALSFRPMLPFVPTQLPDLSGKSVVILSGRYDPIVSREQAEYLFSLLKNAGAKVEMQWQASGHHLTQMTYRLPKNGYRLIFKTLIATVIDQ